MFKNFNRAGPENEPKVIHLSDHAAAESVKELQSAQQVEDPRLAEWLDLKSALHEALLDRLNLSVIEKVEREALRRAVAGVVGQALTNLGKPLNA